MAISVQRLAKGPIGFKMASYDTWDSHAALTGARNTGDWSGLYVALKTGLAEGYGVDYLDDKGNGTAYLHEVHLLCDVELLVCDSAELGDGSKGETEKAALVRSQLPASIKVPDGFLIPQLGLAGNYFFQGLHDSEGNEELIIPNNHLNLVQLIKPVTYKYKGFMRS
jgi:hypothetical protein